MPPFAHIKFFTDCDDEVEQLYHQMLSAKKLGLALGLGPRMDDFDWPFSDAQEIEVSSSDSQFFGQLHPAPIHLCQEAIRPRWREVR